MASITVVHDCDIERRGDGSAPADVGGDFREATLREVVPTETHDGYQVRCGKENPAEKVGDEEYRGIVLFDLNSFLPAGAVITAAVWHFKVFSSSAVSGQTFYIKRCTRTDWVEDNVSWDKYDGSNNWTTGGGDMGTPEVTLGDITTAGWKTFDIKTIVDDAWDNRSGILTFLMFRKVTSDGNLEGQLFFHTKNRRLIPEYDTHHLRITYTLDSKTFEAIIQ